MGLKGYRVMGQLDSNLQSPTALPPAAAAPAETGPAPGVALKVAFERRILKPVFHLIGYRLWV
jgi:hypothetical protein